MKRGSLLLALALLVFTPFHLIEAQQPVKIPRIAIVEAIPTRLIRASRGSGKRCKSSVTLRGKISRLSIATPRGIESAS